MLYDRNDKTMIAELQKLWEDHVSGRDILPKHKEALISYIVEHCPACKSSNVTLPFFGKKFNLEGDTKNNNLF